MSSDEAHENRAAEDFMAHEKAMADEKKRRFVNMREALIDVLVTIERDHDEKFARKLKKRTLDSRSEDELRFVMDGMLVLAGFAIRPGIEEE